MSAAFTTADILILVAVVVGFSLMIVAVVVAVRRRRTQEGRQAYIDRRGRAALSADPQAYARNAVEGFG